MAALEAEAAKLLAALDAGTSSIDDVLGRLYGKAASPDVQIPKAAPGSTMAVAPEYALGPSSDPVVQETINYVGPKDHFPSLDKKYDLVVVLSLIHI